MFEKFGEFDSADEINKAAEGLRAEGDIQGLKILAEENGIDKEDVDGFIEGYEDTLTTPMLAAAGKIDVEEAAAGFPEDILIRDWIKYIQEEIAENAIIRNGVRKKGKSLQGCIGALMKEAFANQWSVPAEIKKAAGVNAGKVTFGVPSMGRAKEIIREYYMEGGHEKEGD